MHHMSLPEPAFAPREPFLIRFVDAYREALVHYRAGLMDPSTFRTVRIQAGVHLQRPPSDRYMVRIKVPYGLLTAGQLRALAVATRYGAKDLHITTRQAVELHDVAQRDTEKVLADMADAGLTTRDAGGNAVRNVVGCPLLGTCPDQSFDAVPVTRQIVRTFLNPELVGPLPRKVKMAVSGCGLDCAAARLQDVGLVARTQGNVAGFRVYVGGGVGATPAVAPMLEDFLPASAIVPFLGAIVRVFQRLGRRDSRHRARLKWLVRDMGIEAFRHAVYQAYEEEMPSMAEPAGAPDAPAQGREASPLSVPNPNDEWIRRRCRKERDGRLAVFLPCPGGELSANTAQHVADWAQSLGNGLITTTARQELVIRGVAPQGILRLRQAIQEIWPEQLSRGIPVISCPGAPHCNLAVTRSNALAQAINAVLTDDVRAHGGAGSEDWAIRICGCPHSCSHVRFAPLGLMGGAVRLGTAMLPIYTLFLGGTENREHPVPAIATRKIPARRVPEAIVRLIRAFRQDAAPDETFEQWARRLTAAEEEPSRDD